MKIKKNKLFLSLFFVLSFFFFVQPVLAESIPEKVPFNGVYDPHSYLSSETISNISVFNWEYTKKTSNKANPRLAVIIIEELDNDIDRVVDYTAESWNFAHSKVFPSGTPEIPDTYELDNGILLFISVKDGLVRTKTAHKNSLDLSEKTISNLENILKNNFEKGNYSQGIYSYVESLKDNLKNPDMKSICLDLEDSVGDDTVEEAVLMLKNTLTKLHQALTEGVLSVSDLPLIFVRVRSPQQLKDLKEILGDDLLSVLTGFNFPKFDRSNAAEYLRTFDNIRNTVPTKLYFNPILESKSIMYQQNRITELSYLQRKLSGFSDNILNIRVGATDFCNIFGMRRKMTQSIYDVGVVANCFVDIVNFFSKNYVVAGPVWEYFNSEGKDGLWKSGLQFELSLDKLNGFFGKTAIHPVQLPVIASSNIVEEEDYQDALNIMGMSSGLIK